MGTDWDGFQARRDWICPGLRHISGRAEVIAESDSALDSSDFRRSCPRFVVVGGRDPAEIEWYSGTSLSEQHPSMVVCLRFVGRVERPILAKFWYVSARSRPVFGRDCLRIGTVRHQIVPTSLA